MDLPSSIAKEIDALAKQGNEAMDREDYESAFNLFNSAWSIIPDPYDSFSESTWILVAIADVFFFTKKWEKMTTPLEAAISCPNGLGNPFIHLRLGQAYLELRQLEKAKDELGRALMGGGKEVFESDDSKYFEFISQHMSPPIGESAW
ncbi:MAG: tetratricopeptide repeat protein [Pseudomonadales bacterium]|nr:tetratricopeptide repeat protein [Pseudomonadales bacterium]